VVFYFATPSGPEFDVFFIGGTTGWKLGPATARLAAQARALGKPVHMGRVSSLKRIRYAAHIGCASADGTFLRFGADIRLPELLGWGRDLRERRPLFAYDDMQPEGSR